MTVLNFLFEPQRVCIAMDTLSVEPELKRPYLFCSKMFLLPHLEGAMCGTGAFPIVIDWFVMIQSRVVVKDIPHLDQFAPGLLRQLAEKHNLSSEITATIYHFGYSRSSSEYRAFVYRSANDFVSEELPYGLGTKPAINVESLEQLPESFIRLIHRQREQDRQAPIQERVGIGGEIQFLVMTPGLFQLRTCHRYEDFELQYQEMLCNIGTP